MCGGNIPHHSDTIGSTRPVRHLDQCRYRQLLLDSIGNRIAVLTEFPFLGSARPDIAVEARLLVEGNYLILYRVTDHVVEIIRVVHGARDLSDI